MEGSNTMTKDLFTFFNELDLLELRLELLDPYVDQFILTESTQTFSGKPKPLYYADNKERFAKWNHKILHNVVGEYETDNEFERAYVQKEHAKHYLEDDDKVYFGDLDEIWTPFEGYAKLRQYNYSYYLNQRSSEDWYGTVTGMWAQMKQDGLNVSRANMPRWDECHGWHFTNMGGVEQVLKKMDAYDHAHEVQSVKAGVEERIKQGQDYLGRKADYQGKPFTFWVSEEEWPEYLKLNKERYKHLCKF